MRLGIGCAPWASDRAPLGKKLVFFLCWQAVGLLLDAKLASEVPCLNFVQAKSLEAVRQAQVVPIEKPWSSFAPPSSRLGPSTAFHEPPHEQLPHLDPGVRPGPSLKGRLGCLKREMLDQFLRPASTRDACDPRQRPCKPLAPLEAVA